MCWLDSTHWTSKRCISLKIFKTDVQDFRKIRPLGSSVPLRRPKLWWSFGLFGLKLLYYFIVANYIVPFLPFYSNLICSSKRSKVFKQFGREGLTLTSRPLKQMLKSWKKKWSYFFFLFIALLHSWDHCNKRSPWSCNNWCWFFFVTTPLSHHKLISILIWKMERNTQRPQEDKNVSHSFSINHMVLLLDIYRKNWERVCCRTVRPGTNVTAQ